MRLRLRIDLNCRRQKRYSEPQFNAINARYRVKVKPANQLKWSLVLGCCLISVCCTQAAQPANHQSAANQSTVQSKSANDNSASRPEQKTTGSIEVTSSPPGARVLLVSTDEGGAGEPQARGQTPTTISGLKPGKYTVDIEKAGYRFFQKDVAVTDGKTVQINATLKKQ